MHSDKPRDGVNRTPAPKRHVYADNAASTRLAPAAFDAMVPWLRDEYVNPSQPHTRARAVYRFVNECRERIAAAIGAARPDEIYFTSGGTESDNWAIKGAALHDDGPRKTTLVSAIEHHAILNPCGTLERLGLPVTRLEPGPDGIARPETLRRSIAPDVRLVSIMLANNELGAIQPIQRLAEIAHESGALFHTDAVQALGHVAVDVQTLGVDLLSASAHKFNGPRGVGFLYLRKGTPIAPLIEGGAQENRMRAGTENVAGIAGMTTALEENVSLVPEHTATLRRLEERLLAGLQTAGVAFRRNGPTAPDDRLPGLLSLAFPGANGETLLHRLDLMGITVSTGSACDSQNTQISHVLKAIRLEESLALGTIRISLGRDSNDDDVDAIVRAIAKIVLK